MISLDPLLNWRKEKSGTRKKSKAGSERTDRINRLLTNRNRPLSTLVIKAMLAPDVACLSHLCEVQGIGLVVAQPSGDLGERGREGVQCVRGRAGPCWQARLPRLRLGVFSGDGSRQPLVQGGGDEDRPSRVSTSPGTAGRAGPFSHMLILLNGPTHPRRLTGDPRWGQFNASSRGRNGDRSGSPHRSYRP